MIAAPLTPADAASLARLAASPIAQQIAEQHEQERAARRAAVLTAAARAKAAAQAELVAATKAVLPHRDEVRRSRDALVEATHALAQHERREQQAADAVDRVATQLRRDLADLGGEAIDEALASVNVAIRRAQAGVNFAIQRDARGRETAVDRNPEQRRHAQRLADLVRELERLRDDHAVTPREIERACAEARAEVDAGAAASKRPTAARVWVVPPA